MLQEECHFLDLAEYLFSCHYLFHKGAKHMQYRRMEFGGMTHWALGITCERLQWVCAANSAKDRIAITYKL